MNYRPRNNSVSVRARNIRIAVGAVLAALLLALRFFAPAFSSHMITAAASPFLRGGFAVSQVASPGAAVDELTKSKSELVAENKELRGELSDAATKLALSNDLQSENAELRKLLGIAEATKGEPAIVLSKPPTSPYDSLVIEAGSGASLSAGDKVYADGNILLGEVSDVSGSTADVRLYSTAGSELDAVIERNNIAQKVAGAGGGNFEIKAPKEVDIAVGDVLVIPGLSNKVLGIVSQIDSQPTDSFQNILVKSPVNIFQLKWVTIEPKA